MRTNLRQQYHAVNKLLPIPPVGCQFSLAKVTVGTSVAMWASGRDPAGAAPSPCFPPFARAVSTDGSAAVWPVACGVAKWAPWPRGRETSGFQTDSKTTKNASKRSGAMRVWQSWRGHWSGSCCRPAMSPEAATKMMANAIQTPRARRNRSCEVAMDTSASVGDRVPVCDAILTPVGSAMNREKAMKPG